MARKRAGKQEDSQKEVSSQEVKVKTADDSELEQRGESGAEASEPGEPSKSFEEILEEKDARISNLNDELLYLRAETDNFKKRSEKRYRDALKYAEEPLLRDLLPVLDNLERALDHAREGGEDGFASLLEGLGHIVQQFSDVLGRHGVESVPTENVKFDPAVHEAMAQVPGKENGQVANAFEKGYLFRGRLIRPAKVCVTKVAQSNGDG